MSSNPSIPTSAAPHSNGEHPSFLAHHFHTPEQQFASGKLGMWVFLGTEILMFGGLFCAYGVYRHNHPEVFLYAADKYLNGFLGGLNTIVLISSSFTMAWAVRCAQLGKRGGSMVLLGLTLLGGLTFMGVKGIEYHDKWKEHVWVGTWNMYSAGYKGSHKPEPAETPLAPAAPMRPSGNTALDPAYLDPNAGTPDQPKIKPTFAAPSGLARQVIQEQAHAIEPPGQQHERELVATFFSIYFLMTGLHGLHVLIGMGLITWVLVRSARGAFSPRYFAPVDLVGLYWHLVNLIWIFLFPMLYLIH